MTKLFVWSSDATRNYTPGYLMAVADNVDEARILIRAKIVPWIREHREWALPEHNGGDNDEYDEIVAKFTADLREEPEEHETLIINGSE